MGIGRGYSRKELKRIAAGPKGNRGKVLVDPRAPVTRPNFTLKVRRTK